VRDTILVFIYIISGALYLQIKGIDQANMALSQLSGIPQRFLEKKHSNLFLASAISKG
jgi:hypothetical protein